MEFKWDENKAATNEADHGVSFEEAKEAFLDPYAVIAPDDEHSWEEQRFRIIGATSKKLLIVIYVELAEELFGIITAREAGKREKRLYYEN